MFLNSWLPAIGTAMANVWLIDHRPFIWSLERALPISLAIAPLGILAQIFFERVFRSKNQR